jgi:hypothetical protein
MGGGKKIKQRPKITDQHNLLETWFIEIRDGQYLVIKILLELTHSYCQNADPC